MTHTLTDPDCPQSVRDQINGAAQPTTQAIQQAREIAAEVAEAMEGCLCDDCMDHGTRIIADALTAALAHLPAGSEAVKPLHWISLRPGYWIAKSAFGQYQVTKLNVPVILPEAVWYAPDGGKTDADSVQEAKAAAQADFERRVRSCLTPPSTPPAANVQEMGE